MLHYLPGKSGRQLQNNEQHSVLQLGRWNPGSLLLHRDSAPDVANLLLVVDAMQYGMMEIARCALCLWAIPYLPHESADDPFVPFYVPTSDLVFPHEKGLVIRCLQYFAQRDGASVILPVGAAGYTATDEPDSVSERSDAPGRECTPAESGPLHCGCRAGLCIPKPGQEE